MDGGTNDLMICHTPCVCVIKLSQDHKEMVTLSLIIRMENLSALCLLVLCMAGL